MQEQANTPVKTRGLWAWSTRDILIVAVTSLVFGFFLIGSTYLYYAVAVLGPIVYWALNGLWLVPPIFMAYVIRRPGSALLTSLISCLLLIPFTPYGVASLFSGSLFGVLTELSLFLFTRYRAFGWIRLALVGILCGVLLLAITGASFGVFVLAPGVMISVFLSTLVGCVLCALLARALADALARAGVFAGTGLRSGKQSAAEVEE
jgi:energy-coupling factor transport system permease protein